LAYSISENAEAPMYVSEHGELLAPSPVSPTHAPRHKLHKYLLSHDPSKYCAAIGRNRVTSQASKSTVACTLVVPSYTLPRATGNIIGQHYRVTLLALAQ
jgi:hypothetical protein